MKNKFVVISYFCLLLSSCCALAANYKVNQSGVVKNPNNKTPLYSNTINQNYYNNYYSEDYINSNQVNSFPVKTIEFVMDYSGSMSNYYTPDSFDYEMGSFFELPPKQRFRKMSRKELTNK